MSGTRLVPRRHVHAARPQVAYSSHAEMYRQTSRHGRWVDTGGWAGASQHADGARRQERDDAVHDRGPVHDRLRSGCSLPYPRTSPGQAPARWPIARARTSLFTRAESAATGSRITTSTRLAISGSIARASSSPAFTASDPRGSDAPTEADAACRAPATRLARAEQPAQPDPAIGHEDVLLPCLYGTGQRSRTVFDAHAIRLP